MCPCGFHTVGAQKDSERIRKANQKRSGIQTVRLRYVWMSPFPKRILIAKPLGWQKLRKHAKSGSYLFFANGWDDCENRCNETAEIYQV